MQAQRHFLLEDLTITPKTTYQMFRYILKTEGVQLGLYKGISMNLIKVESMKIKDIYLISISYSFTITIYFNCRVQFQ